MGLFQKAVETYDAMQSLAGVKEEGKKEMLAPIGFAIRNATIEITIDENGNFVRASKINEKIPIPCTEKSAGRSSGIAAHPLCDNLTYVTNLYADKHNAYMKGIEAWKESKYGNPKLDAIYNYLQKNSVLNDCVKSGIVEPPQTGKVKGEEALVVWRVEGFGEKSGAVYEDKELMESYSKYYIECNSVNVGICMVTGKTEMLAIQHLGGVLGFNGTARLISANDSSNYTYRGRFFDADEALTVGYLSSQKAHNALKWLLSNYGVSIGDRRMVCWNPKGKKIPEFNLPLIKKSDEKIIPSDYKEELKKVLNGYEADLPKSENVVIAAFEAATNGRLSVTYYNELQGSDFLDRLYYWDSTCCWFDNSCGTGSPELKQIINLAFGTERESGKIECDSKVLGQQLQRLISCRLDKSMFPKDIMRNLVIKASNLQVYSKENADKLLFTACAAIKKCKYDYLKEEWDMALDANKADRSYQFGRLLAILEKIERDTYGGGEERDTNAIRAQAFYSRRPLTAFKQIMEALKTGYYPRLSAGAKVSHEKLIGSIMQKISDVSNDEELDKPLTETYLMGYYLQKNALYTKKENKQSEEE